jgi:hypothetical protein
MYDNFSRTQLVRQAWKASAGGRFSETALVESAAGMVDETLRPNLRQALPALWLRLDETVEVVDWLATTGLDGDAIDAINAALGAGLPQSAKKASLHEYALRPQDFPALLFLALIAARLATPYEGGGPHRKVRAQFWFAPELAIIVMRCLPPKLDLLTVEHILRKILQAPVGQGFDPYMTAGIPSGVFPPGTIGEPPCITDLMGMIEPPKYDDGKA